MRRPNTQISDKDHQMICRMRLFTEVDTNLESAKKVVEYLDKNPGLKKSCERIYKKALRKVLDARLAELCKEI